MKQIRQSTFETNSSSTHSLTVCTEQEFNEWKEGKRAFDLYGEKLVPIEDCPEDADLDEEAELWERSYCTYDQWESDWEQESYEKRYTSPSGDKIVAFGKFGYDG